MEAIFSVFLLAAAYEDFRKRQVSLAMCAVMAAAGGANIFIQGSGNGRELLPIAGFSPAFSAAAGLLPGMVLLFLSWISGESVGEGDGWFMMAAGLCLGFRRTLYLLLAGMILCGLFCLVILVSGIFRGRSMKNTMVPFLPFLVPVWIFMVKGG